MNFGGPARARRRPGLTPMIDVVFLLLVFFMLAARFGVDDMRPLLLPAMGDAATWDGAPRLVEVTPGSVSLNGAAVEESGLVAALQPLLPAPDAPVLVRPRSEASVQRLIDITERLEAAGLRALLIEGD